MPPARSAQLRLNNGTRCNCLPSAQWSVAAMHETIKHEISRRDFLRLGVTVAAGVVVPPVVSGCGGGDDSGYVGPKETFVEPLNIQSVNGVLDVTIIVSYVTMPFQGTIVTLRNM